MTTRNANPQGEKPEETFWHQVSLGPNDSDDQVYMVSMNYLLALAHDIKDPVKRLNALSAMDIVDRCLK